MELTAIPLVDDDRVRSQDGTVDFVYLSDALNCRKYKFILSDKRFVASKKISEKRS